MSIVSKISTSLSSLPAKPEAEPNARLRRYTVMAAIVGAFSILVFCASPSGEGYFTRVGTSLSLGLGAVVLGGLLGFVFGIPRTLQHDISPTAGKTAEASDNIAYQINTNLEQISDWLTKIIIGVGLVQLGAIGAWLTSFSSEIGVGFGSGVLGRAYVLGLLIYFCGAGFLLGYLWTRLSFGLAIKEADKGLVERRIEKFEADIRADHQALLLVTRQLNPSQGESGVDPAELAATVAKATRHTKTKIFYDAVAARKDPERCAHSIPVFQALAASDTAESFHRTYGQLGYALKDQAKPDWGAAEAALSKAIEIRERLREAGYYVYEFNRAICRIRLDRPVDEVVPDLTRAASDPWIRDWPLDEEAEWFKKNKVSVQALGFS